MSVPLVLGQAPLEMGRRCLPRGAGWWPEKERKCDMGLLEVSIPGFHFGSLLFGFCRAIVFLMLGGRGQITHGSPWASHKTLHICSSQILKPFLTSSGRTDPSAPVWGPTPLRNQSQKVWCSFLCVFLRGSIVLCVKIEDSSLRMPGFGSWLHHPWLCDPGHVFSPLLGPITLSVYLSIYLSVCPCICLPIHLSIYLSVMGNNIYVILMKMKWLNMWKELEECLAHSKCQPRVCVTFLESSKF